MDSEEENGWVSDEEEAAPDVPAAEAEAAEAALDQQDIAGPHNPSTILDLILLQ